MSLLIAVLALGFLIFVHELGHFLAAKWCGVKVERFSLGFGKTLLGKKVGETEYVICAIPLGGYVKMHGDIPEEWMAEGKGGLEDMGQKQKPEGQSPVGPAEPPEPIDKSRSYLHKPIPQRLLIAFAGPAFNLIFGYIAILGFFWIEPQPVPLVGGVEEGSGAYSAGLQTGDEILSVNGEKVRFFSDLDDLIEKNRGGAARIEYRRQGRVQTVDVPVGDEEGINVFGESVRIGTIGIAKPLSALIQQVQPESPADRGGVKAGDRITAVGGVPVRFWDQVSRAVRGAETGAPLALEVERAGKRLLLSVTPQVTEIEVDGKKESRPLIGIQASAEAVESRPAGFRYAFAQAPAKTWQICVMIPTGLYKLVVGDVPRNQIGGPIEIGAQLKRAAEVGLSALLSLMAIISINLGILNLLPIPVLDGGHIFFFLMEALNRKAVSLRTREIAQQVGLSLIILLMLFALYNDIGRYGMKFLREYWPRLLGLMGRS